MMGFVTLCSLSSCGEDNDSCSVEIILNYNGNNWQHTGEDLADWLAFGLFPNLRKTGAQAGLTPHST